MWNVLDLFDVVDETHIDGISRAQVEQLDSATSLQDLLLAIVNSPLSSGHIILLEKFIVLFIYKVCTCLFLLFLMCSSFSLRLTDVKSVGSISRAARSIKCCIWISLIVLRCVIRSFPLLSLVSCMGFQLK
jgi:hypothetical protein